LDYIKDNCEFIVVITEDISEAFQFFDSQNTRGKKLYPTDLLKAYHLREMRDEMKDSKTTEKEEEEAANGWQELDQKELSKLFTNYLYCIKEWLKGNTAEEFTKDNYHKFDIEKFKGITRKNNYPYAKFYKGADPENLKSFQLEAPIIAGKPFFDYAQHYFKILNNIRNSDKSDDHRIKDNPIIKTLNLPIYKYGKSDKRTRLLFDIAILLYIDRFGSESLERFIKLAFRWAYSLRAQSYSLRWSSTQKHIMERKYTTSSFNIYKIISEADSPDSLLRALSDSEQLLKPLKDSDIHGIYKPNANDNERQAKAKAEKGIFLTHFKENNGGPK
jgi:hypothetical protein